MNYLNFIFLIFLVVNSDKEYDSHGSSNTHYHQGVHNSDYDKKFVEGFLNLDGDLSNLTLEQITEKLEEHFKQIDVNADEKLNREELVHAILKYYQNQDTKEAISKMSDVDFNKDKKVQWSEYLLKVYRNTEEEIEGYRKDISNEMKEYLGLVDEDAARFQAADVNGKRVEDNENDKRDKEVVGLDVVEYGSFLNPSNHPNMREYELKLSMKRVDRNADDFLSFDEYLGEATLNEEQRKDELQSFLSYDTNGDGRLDRYEISHWLMPDQRSLSDNEADHLILQLDQDQDASISLAEIISQYSLWLNSPITQYAAHKHHDPSEL